MLWLAKRVIFGETKNTKIKEIKDINFSEGIILSILALTVIFFGFYPLPLISTMSVSVDNLINNYNMDLVQSMVIQE